MKTADFRLPIYKQGDDLAQHLRSKGSNEEALLAYAEDLRLAAELCEALAEEVKGKSNLTIDADTHIISVEGPTAFIDGLIRKDLLEEQVGRRGLWLWQREGRRGGGTESDPS